MRFKLAIFFAFAFAFSRPLLAQLEVKGTVKAEDTGTTLPGVNVFIKNTTSGAVTDIDGNYVLIVNNPNDTIVFSYIGYQRQEVGVGGRSAINILLAPETSLLDEIVVIGYGTVQKSDLTGSVSSVKSEEMIKSPGSDPIGALQGKVSGLQVLNGSGEPGSGPYVRLRGINTLNDNRVLYVVDGVIMSGGVGFLNSRDIESVEVLKDASSKAIFGTRGANGVIIITTKLEKGEARINFSTENSFSSIANQLDLMSGPEFATFINKVFPGTYNNIGALPDVDWQDMVFKNRQPLHNYTLSVSGSTEKVSYYASGAYFQQKGIVPKSAFERFTFKSNTSYLLKENWKLGTNLTGTFNNRDNTPGVINSVYWAWPINSPYNSDSSFAEVQGAGNPLAAIAYTNSRTNGLKIIGNVYSEIGFLNDFTFKTSYQFDLGNDKTRSFVPVYFVSPTQQNLVNDFSVNFGESRRWIFENTLSFNKTIDKHKINAIVGYSAQENNFEYLGGSREGLLGESKQLWYLNSGSGENQQNSNGAFQDAITSVLFRANYVYDGLYLLTLTMRRDGSSKFGPNNRYANFPAVALGWNLSNESFFPKEGLLGHLKLRAGWGVNGNEKINGEDQYSRIGAGLDAVFGVAEALNSGATFYGQPGNPDLRWERTSEYDFGLEFGISDDRLTGEFDYYNRLTNDILVKLDLPGYAGAGAYVQKTFNAASIRNSGLEFMLNWQDNFGEIDYGIGLNGNTIHNEVKSLGEDIPGAGNQIISGDLGNGQRVTITKVGQPVGEYFGYRTIGIFQDADQLASLPHLYQQRVGDFIYEDVNNDGILNADDRTVLGSWIPRFVFGFDLKAGYKGLGLSLDFAGQSGGKIYNGKQTIRFATLNFEDRFNNYWDGAGSGDNDPRPSVSGVNFLPSDYFLEDASFLKLRTITLSYDLPASLIEKLKIGAASIYCRATNLFMMTGYSGYSPEIAGGASAIGGIIDLGVYPATKMISAGINLSI